MKPKIVATSKSDDAVIWVYGSDKLTAKATIQSSGTPPDESQARPLQAMLAHLDFQEWTWVELE